MERLTKISSTPSLRRNYPVQVQRVLSQPDVVDVLTHQGNPAPRGKSAAKLMRKNLKRV